MQKSYKIGEFLKNKKSIGLQQVKSNALNILFNN
jgi:hypothetical protein